MSNIKRYRVGESKHNTLLRCKVSKDRQHVSALYCKAMIRSDKMKTKEEIYNVTYCLYTRVGTLIVATIYLQLIQNRYMFRSFTVLHCSHQHCVQPVASDVKVVEYL